MLKNSIFVKVGVLQHANKEVSPVLYKQLFVE